ncbi:MAG: putative splicing factor 1 isoform X6, partial [Elusimicrobia bacterium]
TRTFPQPSPIRSPPGNPPIPQCMSPVRSPSRNASPVPAAFPASPRRDPYVYPLCAMTFPPKIPSPMSLSTQSNPRGHMSDRPPSSVYTVNSLDAAPSATAALQPAPAQRYPLCPGRSLSVEPCMLPLDHYSANGHSHPSLRPPLPPGAHGPAPPPAAAGHLASPAHPPPPKWPQSFALGGLTYVWSSRDGTYYDHTGRYEFPYDSPHGPGPHRLCPRHRRGPQPKPGPPPRLLPA